MKSKKVRIIVILIVLAVIVTIGAVIANKTGLLENISVSNNKNPLDNLIGMSLEDALRYVEELGYENWLSEPYLVETTDESLDGKVESYDISNNTVFLNLYVLKETTLNPHGLWASLSEDELALITNYLEQKAKDKYKDKDRYLGYKVNIVDDILYFSTIYADASWAAVSFEGQGYYPKNLSSNWKKESIESLFESKNIVKVSFNSGYGSYATNSVGLSKRYNVSDEEINLAKMQLFEKIDLSIEKERKSVYEKVLESYEPLYPFPLTTIQNLGNNDYNNKISNCLKETTLSADDNIFINANIRDGGNIFKGTFKYLSDNEYVYFNSICHKIETDTWKEEPKYEYITYAVKYKVNIPYSLGIGGMTLEQLLGYKYLEIEAFEMPNVIVVSAHELNENNYYEQYKTIFEKMNLPKYLLFATYGCRDVGSFYFAPNGEIDNWSVGRYKEEGESLTLTIFHQYEGEKDKILKGKVLNDYFVEIDGKIYDCVSLYTNYDSSWLKREY